MGQPDHPDTKVTPQVNGQQVAMSAPLDSEALATATVRQPETPGSGTSIGPTVSSETGIPTAVTRRLYLSHFLSTWNSRSFEFGATLFLAGIYPGTLLYLSIYALVRSASAILFAPAVGRAIDSRDRLSVVRFSIVGQRAAVILSCVGFYCLATLLSISKSTKQGVFATLVILSCVEKNCSVLNLVSIERDWVVVIAGDHEPSLQTLNARMRRIDLFCKLGGPLFISLIDGASVRVATLLTLGINALSVAVEYFAIAKVYKTSPALQRPREVLAEDRSQSPTFPVPGPPTITAYSRVYGAFRSLTNTYKYYFQHSAFLPSFALALLYFTVLSFGGQMVTYLLSAGYTAFYIALVRTLSVLFELSATWIAPRVMRRMAPVRAGLWFLSWQMAWLGAAVAFFWGRQHQLLVAASGLAAGTILSRIGLWSYDLCAQIIVQGEVAPERRGAFSAAEASFQNLFELLSYAATIVFARPDQFRYPVLLSAAAVYLAGCLFGVFARMRRGHLMHVPLVFLKPSDRGEAMEEDTEGRAGIAEALCCFHPWTVDRDESSAT